MIAAGSDTAASGELYFYISACFTRVDAVEKVADLNQFIAAWEEISTESMDLYVHRHDLGGALRVEARRGLGPFREGRPVLHVCQFTRDSGKLL